MIYHFICNNKARTTFIGSDPSEHGYVQIGENLWRDSNLNQGAMKSEEFDGKDESHQDLLRCWFCGDDRFILDERDSLIVQAQLELGISFQEAYDAATNIVRRELLM